MGTMTLRTPSRTTVVGTFDMSGGYVLHLKGTISTGSGGRPSLHIAGIGRPKHADRGLGIRLRGRHGQKWPNGVNQVPAFTGSVIRAKPHNGQPAGIVACSSTSSSSASLGLRGGGIGAA
jgi:hypothetical protein